MNDIFIEDLFCHFFEEIGKKNISLDSIDYNAGMSFYLLLCKGDAVTENQSKFILKILSKYKNNLFAVGFDYTNILQNPKWKKPFRVIDTSKKVFLETDEHNKLILLFQFPFAFKTIFDNELAEVSKKSFWDTDRRLRTINLYDCNLLSIMDFCERHNFYVEESVREIFSQVEHIFEHQSEIIPHCAISGSSLELVNVSDSVKQYFIDNQKDNLTENLLLIKSMGISLQNNNHTKIEKIAASPTTRFWFKSTDDFFETFKDVQGKICVILGTDGDEREWIDSFVESAEQQLIPRNLIKVCFRNDKLTDKGFNTWVKDKQLGGEVNKGQIFIFRQKPAKWLFENINDVKIIVTNTPYPVINLTTQKLLDSHSCVCYIGKLKPSVRGKELIVEL
jgi:hypothetical protein